MRLPGRLRIHSIDIQKIYFDKKSEEQGTGIIKEKYKIAGNKLPTLNICTFFMMTSNRESCKSQFTVTFTPQHCEILEAGHLRNESYVDITKTDVLSEDNVISKMDDLQNEFKYVARLCDSKFSELINLAFRVRTHQSSLSLERVVLIQAALGIDTSNVSEEILEKLRL